MLKNDAGCIATTARAYTPAEAMQIRLLGPGEMQQVEQHLMALDIRDRHARFHAVVSDWMIATYVRQLDPERVILVGALDHATGQLLGLAEAHPVTPSHTVEMAVTVEPSCRRRGLGQRLVIQALTHAFARGAEAAEFLFIPSNAALAGLATALGAKVDVLRGYAAISRVTQVGAWQKAA